MKYLLRNNTTLNYETWEALDRLRIVIKALRYIAEDLYDAHPNIDFRKTQKNVTFSSM